MLLNAVNATGETFWSCTVLGWRLKVDFFLLNLAELSLKNKTSTLIIH